MALMDSGKFDDFFSNNSLFLDILNKINMLERKVFELHNPLISDETKNLIENEALWLKLLQP